MSRHIIDIDENTYMNIGWDPPLQSYWWDIWNQKDEERIITLENKKTNKTSKEEEELESLYSKYETYGGDPIIGDSLLGVHVIDTVDKLEAEVSKYVQLPINIRITLINDKRYNK